MRYEEFSPRQLIVRANSPIHDIAIVCEGWALRRIVRPNGVRQLAAVILPGEPVWVGSVFRGFLYFSALAAGPVTCCFVDRAFLSSKIVESPRLMRQLVDRGIAECERADRMIVSLSQHSAEQRVADFFLSLVERIEEAGAPNEDGFYSFPLKQAQLAELLGLTPVTVSQILNRFRSRRIFELNKGTLTIMNRKALEAIAID